MTDGQDSPCAQEDVPLLSIVIPVWNIEKYLDACLDSILGQSFRDLEIVAVEGASTDSSGTILDKRAAQDARLSVIHLDPPAGEDRVGPGRARNTGLARAKGEYVWFVDGDDAIEPGCLTTIANRIGRDGPDLLVIGNVLVSADGKRTRRGHGQHLLRPEEPLFTLADRPAIAGIGMEPWNKIVRRKFLLSTQATFLAKWPHEDVPVSCAVLVAARRIGILSTPCYRYRQDRRGSAMAASSARHFNVFNAWRGVLSAARDRRDACDPTVPPGVYAVLFERSIGHLTNIYDKGSMSIRRSSSRYVRSDSRRKFFTQMHLHYAAYKPPGYRRPAAFKGIKFILIERNAFAGYVLLAQLNAIRNGLRRARRPSVPAHAEPA